MFAKYQVKLTASSYGVGFIFLKNGVFPSCANKPLISIKSLLLIALDKSVIIPSTEPG